MVKKCCVKGCQSNWYPNTHWSFFSDHFEDSAFKDTSMRRQLHENAVPTIFDCVPKEVIVRKLQSTARLYVNSTTQTTVEPAQIKKDAGTQICSHRLAPSDAEEKLRRKVKILQCRLRRRELKISNVTRMLKHLKQEGKKNATLETDITKQFSGFNLELFENEVANGSKSKPRKHYTDKMKEFALTLYFHSPKAYDFVRSKLNLPHEATLRKWIAEAPCEVDYLSDDSNPVEESLVSFD